MNELEQFIENHIHERRDVKTKLGKIYVFFVTIDRKKTIIKSSVNKDRLREWIKNYMLNNNIEK